MSTMVHGVLYGSLSFSGVNYATRDKKSVTRHLSHVLCQAGKLGKREALVEANGVGGTVGMSKLQRIGALLQM